MNSVRGITGSCARVSAMTNSTAKATQPTMSATNAGEPYEITEPPSEIASTRQLLDAASVSMPGMSIAPADRFGCSRCGSATAAATRAIAPSGTLIQKHQRHETYSVNRPPRRGPRAMLTPKEAPITPMYLLRSFGGKMSATMACDRIMSLPPPRP